MRRKSQLTTKNCHGVLWALSVFQTQKPAWIQLSKASFLFFISARGSSSAGSPSNAFTAKNLEVWCEPSQDLGQTRRSGVPALRIGSSCQEFKSNRHSIRCWSVQKALFVLSRNRTFFYHVSQKRAPEYKVHVLWKAWTLRDSVLQEADGKWPSGIVAIEVDKKSPVDATSIATVTLLDDDHHAASRDGVAALTKSTAGGETVLKEVRHNK